uniref:Uncharacterized protein n=1 Tax=Heterorhabditis bacteriophora TaxID=37862 RepID=A0A1I7WZT4_HETBA
MQEYCMKLFNIPNYFWLLITNFIID